MSTGDSNWLALLFLWQIYAVGGFDGFYRLSSVECYDTFSNSWSTLAPLPQAVSSAAVVSCLNKLYVLGGAVDDTANTDKVWVVQGGEDGWEVETGLRNAK